MAHNGYQDKGRRLINLHEAQIGNVLPDHFKEAYPKFITLLEKYYEFQDQNDPAELINHLFDTRDITETDLTLLNYIEDELLLGERYAEGFPDRRAAANFSSILFRSKGSKYSIEWFFRSFFGEDVEVIYPKNNVFNIGSSSIGPDSEKYITNNELYQTFSLLIKAGIPFSRWREMFKLFAHPAGMYLGAQVLLEGVGEATVSGDGVVSDQTTASYSMAASADPETEGETVTITVTGTNTPHSGTEALYWYIVHGTTDNDDFNMTVPTSAAPQYVAMSGSSASFDIVLNKDLERDDGETYTVYLVNQYDRVLDTIGLTINDDLPVYTVSSPTATEGSDLVFNITLDDDFYDGTTLNWTLDGALKLDGRVATTFGTVDITGQTGTITMPTTATDTYSGPTTGTLNVFDNRFSPAVTSSGTATLNDASATYSIVVDPAYAAEGTTVDVDVSGTNISVSTLYLAVTHGTTTDADFSTQPPGQGATAREAIALTGNAGSTTLTYASNSDITNETFTVELWDSLTGGTKLDEFEAVITAQSYTFTTISDTNLSEFNEDTATFTFTTSDADGTYYYWFETVSGTLTSDDFQAGEWKTSGSRGTFTVTGGTGTFSIQALADGTLEGNATFKAYVSTGAASAAVADSQTDLGAGGIVTVTDDSTATYSVVANNVTEGSTFSFTVTASNYDNENVNWTITGDAASRTSVWSATSGTITSGDFSGGVATVLVTTTNNASTDSPDPATGTLTVTGATGGSTANDTFQLSDPVILPTYTAFVDNIIEGENLVVEIDAVNNNGETVYIEVTGSGVTGRITTTQTTSVISTDAPTNVTISTTTLSNTYQGVQSGTVTIGRGDYVSGTGTLLASDTFTMSDAALTGTISSTDGYAIDEDQGTYNWAVSGTNLADTGTASYYWIITSVANPTVFATTDATANSGQAVIPLADTTDIAVGYKSTNASVGGTVVSKTSGTVTMSTNLTGTLSSGTNILFYDADLDNKFSAPSGEVTMSSNAGTWTVTVSEDTTQDDFTGTMALYQGWGTTLVDDQSFTVSDLTPNAPTITAPTNGSTIDTSTPTITISGAPASHSKTDWQIASDASFTTIHEQSLADASNLTSYTITSALTEGVTYYIRVRTYTNDVESAWSSTVSFAYWEIATVTLSDTSVRDVDQYPSAAYYWSGDGSTLSSGSEVVLPTGAWINDTSNPSFDPTDYEILINPGTNVNISLSYGNGITPGSYQDMPSSGTSIIANPSGVWSPIVGSQSVSVTVTIREKANPSGNQDTQTVGFILSAGIEP